MRFPQPKPEYISMADTSLSGLSPDQAKEFHEQFKTTFSAFVAVAGLVHVLVFAAKPWF
jgi:light-harvesting complex 1 beta chain